MRRALLALVLLALAGCLGPDEARPAPAFHLTTTDGEAVNLSTHAGRVVILDLMATWCTPCQREMRHLQAVDDAYPDDEVAILSISIEPGDTDADLEAFRDRHGGTWPFARDTDDVAANYDLGIIPKLVIIDARGRIVFENDGETYPATMSQVIARAQGGDVPAPAPRVDVRVPLALLLGAVAPFNPYAAPKAARFLNAAEGKRRPVLLAAAGVAALGILLLVLTQAGSALVSSRLYGTAGVAGLGGAAAGAWALLHRPSRTPEKPKVTSLAAVGLALDAYVDTAPFWVLVVVLAFTAPDPTSGLAPVLVYAAAFTGGALWLGGRVRGGEGPDVLDPRWRRATGGLMLAAALVLVVVWLGVL